MAAPATQSRRYARAVGILVLVLLIGVPVLELWVFVQVAGAVGFWWALLLALTIFLGGVWMVKRQGIATGRHLRARLARGEQPGKELADSGLLLVAGLLLLFPGFVTGVLGLLLLLPPVRALLRPLMGRHATVVTVTCGPGSSAPSVVEATATEVRGEIEP